MYAFSCCFLDWTLGFSLLGLCLFTSVTTCFFCHLFCKTNGPKHSISANTAKSRETHTETTTTQLSAGRHRRRTKLALLNSLHSFLQSEHVCCFSCPVRVSTWFFKHHCTFSPFIITHCIYYIHVWMCVLVHVHNVCTAVVHMVMPSWSQFQWCSLKCGRMRLE